jgi:16S rRNA (guanine(1405)-N(7))-methyltransferase
MPDHQPDLDELARQVQALAKYRSISTDLVKDLLGIELAKRANPREAVKAVRNKLHQVGGAYQEKPPPYDQWLAELAALPADLAHPAVHAFLQRILPAHASTRERVPILPRFFRECLFELGEVESMLDIACGLNPLAIPWMPLKPGFTYTACDIYSDMVDFLNQYFIHFGINGTAQLADVTRSIPDVDAQLTLVLKTIPCLEQMDKDAGRSLLSTIQSPNILVSFPARSLGGRAKGMPQFYEQHFRALVAAQPWQLTRFEFPGELAFLIRK